MVRRRTLWFGARRRREMKNNNRSKTANRPSVTRLLRCVKQSRSTNKLILPFRSTLAGAQSPSNSPLVKLGTVGVAELLDLLDLDVDLDVTRWIDFNLVKILARGGAIESVLRDASYHSSTVVNLTEASSCCAVAGCTLYYTAPPREEPSSPRRERSRLLPPRRAWRSSPRAW